MRVLVACEFSGIVRDAFRARGHDAWSCDLLSSEREGPHFTGDVTECFTGTPGPGWGALTMAGDPFDYPRAPIGPWDLMIAFPPCTHLAVSGARWFSKKEREQDAALDFVRFLMLAPVDRIAIENPISIISSRIRKPDQIIQPWHFGHPETKATCLWLKNLAPLRPTKIVEGRTARVHREPPSPDRWKNRSRTLQGIADAMAEQWGASETSARSAPESPRDPPPETA